MFPDVQSASLVLYSAPWGTGLVWNHGRGEGFRSPGAEQRPEPMEDAAMSDLELATFAEQVAQDARRIFGPEASAEVLDHFAREAVLTCG